MALLALRHHIDFGHNNRGRAETYIGGVLGAAAIYVLLRRQMRYLTSCRRWRRSLAASVLLVEAVICFLIPLSLIVWMFVSKIQDMTLDPQSSMDAIRGLADRIREKTHSICCRRRTSRRS